MIDEVFKSNVKYQESTGELFHEVSQPDEDKILQRNANLRKNPSALKDLGQGSQTWGRMLASIPFIMYEKAKRDGYDLENKDPEIATKELNRYLRSPEGKLCMVREK